VITTSIKPNVTLLGETLAQIEARPNEFDPDRFRTPWGAMCFGARACVIDGGVWAVDDTASPHAHLLLARPGDPDESVQQMGDERVISVYARARRILRLTEHQAADLLAGGNSVTDLRRIVARICQASAVPPQENMTAAANEINNKISELEREDWHDDDRSRRAMIHGLKIALQVLDDQASPATRPDAGHGHQSDTPDAYTGCPKPHAARDGISPATQSGLGDCPAEAADGSTSPRERSK
jgi:hypothetical protein